MDASAFRVTEIEANVDREASCPSVYGVPEVGDGGAGLDLNGGTGALIGRDTGRPIARAVTGGANGWM